jgi:hypothetical protein
MVFIWTLNKYSVRMWTGLNWLSIEIGGELLEHINKPFISIRGMEFLNQLSDLSSLQELCSVTRDA